MIIAILGDFVPLEAAVSVMAFTLCYDEKIIYWKARDISRVLRKVKDKSKGNTVEKRYDLLTLFSIKPHDRCHIWAFLRYAVAREAL